MGHKGMGELRESVGYRHIIGDRLDAFSNAAQDSSFLVVISLARCEKAAVRLVFMAMRCMGRGYTPPTDEKEQSHARPELVLDRSLNWSTRSICQIAGQTRS
jgi:hypothetical protein